MMKNGSPVGDSVIPFTVFAWFVFFLCLALYIISMKRKKKFLNNIDIDNDLDDEDVALVRKPSPVPSRTTSRTIWLWLSSATRRVSSARLKERRKAGKQEIRIAGKQDSRIADWKRIEDVEKNMIGLLVHAPSSMHPRPCTELDLNSCDVSVKC